MTYMHLFSIFRLQYFLILHMEGIDYPESLVTFFILGLEAGCWLAKVLHYNHIIVFHSHLKITSPSHAKITSPSHLKITSPSHLKALNGQWRFPTEHVWRLPGTSTKRISHQSHQYPVSPDKCYVYRTLELF